MSDLIPKIETAMPIVHIPLQLHEPISSHEGVHKILNIPLYGEVSDDTEEILKNRAIVLKAIQPGFVKIASQFSFGCGYGNGSSDKDIIPVKLCLRENLAYIEPGIAIDGTVFSVRGINPDLEECLMTMIEDDNFYCEI